MTSYVNEYIARLRFTKIGFTDALDNLTSIDADIFNFIAFKFDNLERIESEQARKR